MGQTQHMNVLKNNIIDSISINSKLIHYNQKLIFSHQREKKYDSISQVYLCYYHFEFPILC